MSTHTPGPWRLQQDDSPEHEYEHCHVVAVNRKNDEVIAFVEYGENGDGNARLIAAAPELLATLKEVLATLKEIIGRRAGTVVRAVIAKAEGRES